jgi:predicted aspartyl protease
LNTSSPEIDPKSNMNIFKIQICASNPADEKMVTTPVEILINTGSEFTWLPRAALSRIGVSPCSKRMFYTRTLQKVERDTACVILCANGHRSEEEVVFAEPGDAIVVGQGSLEGLGVTVDDPEQGFVALTTLVGIQSHGALKAA